MRRVPHTTTVRLAAAAAAVLFLGACGGEDGPDEGTEDGTATADDGVADDGDDGADDAGERPASDLALAEQQREEFIEERAGVSDLQSTGTIGSSTDRIGELESAYDATETEQQETQLTVPDNVLFDFDSDELRPEASDVLGEIAEVIEHYDGAAVEIRGHTDDIGSDAYNQDLSERRAEAVVRYLVDQAGVDAGRLTATGAGSSEPVADNANADGSDNPEGRAQNRRVEVTIDG